MSDTLQFYVKGSDVIIKQGPDMVVMTNAQAVTLAQAILVKFKKVQPTV